MTNILSWNLLSYLVKSKNTDSQDPANASVIYKNVTFPPEEDRFALFQKILLDFFSLPAISPKLPHCMCFFHTPALWVQNLFEPEDGPAGSPSIFFRSKSSNYSAVFVADQVDFSRKELLAPHSGLQGILFVYYHEMIKIDKESVLSLGNPFNYYFGIGSVQLFITAIFSKKSPVMFAFSESYPMSWPLLLDETPIISTTDVKHLKPGTQFVPIILFAKPRIRVDYVSFEGKTFDPTTFLDHILSSEDHIYFAQEENALRSKFLKGCNIPIRYPEKVPTRYRFIRFRQDPNHLKWLHSFADVKKELTLQFIQQQIFSIQKNPDIRNQYQIMKSGDLWSEFFHFDSDVVLILDAIFIAETDALFFQERRQLYHTNLPQAYDPYLPDNKLNRSIVTCVSYPYDVNRTQLEHLVLTGGQHVPWITSAIKDRKFEDVKKWKNPYISSPTWWLPLYKRMCPTNGNFEALTFGCDLLVSDLFSCQSIPVPEIERYGIVADGMYFYSAEPGAKMFAFKKLIYTTEEIRAGEPQAWGSEPLLDLYKFLSDRLAILGSFDV